MKLSTFIVGASALAIANPTKRASGLRWLGANEAGAEFGSNIPGTLGTDYTWPDPNAIDLLIADGMNLFRVPFMMERLSPDAVDGKFSAAYLQSLVSTITHITGKGAWAVVDPHNYGRYKNTLLAPATFQTFWANVAQNFVNNDHVIFDTNNEYNSMDNSLVVQLNQAAINGIRSAGATSQYIFVEGNAWSGSYSWVANNDGMKVLTDPSNKIIFEMHNYFNSDASSSSVCISSTIGSERLVTATQWLRANNKIGVIGEFSGYGDATCKAAVQDFLQYLSANSDVWTGALWWAAGPWWGSGEYSYEPPTGPAYLNYKSILKPFIPGSASSPPTTSTILSTSKPPQSTTVSPPTSTAVPTGGSCSSKWGQCGGQGWTGPSCCQAGSVCTFSNNWYSQCL
ncbi:putative cellulase [Cadophora sp. MPI-SDFR-AT-0126]|nr:putative cellulase [Leotiomycetes sp. MPI-SDFR-AT-0126]